MVSSLAWPSRTLDDADVDAVLQKVRRKRMAQRMRPDALGDLGRPRRLDDNAVKLARRKGPCPALAGKKPALTMQDALPLPLDPLLA